MGITEPVLYGLNLPKKYPLAASMIGGALGGLYAGITHTHRFATGSSGIPAVLLYIGDDTMRYFYNIIIALIITAVSTAVITFVLSLKYEKKPETAEPEKVLENPAEAKNSGAKEEDLGIYAPVKGKTAAMESIPDETFSSGVLGKGLGIWPEAGTVFAPFDGEILQAADTGHALGIVSTEGIELLIHVGIDTVEMNGAGFSVNVKEGDSVKAGQKLLTFDRKAIEKAGHPDIVVIMVTNADDYAEVNCAPEKNVSVGEKIIDFKK